MKKCYFLILILFSLHIFGQAFLFKKNASGGIGLTYSVSDFKKDVSDQERLEMIGFSGFIGMHGKFELGFAYGKMRGNDIKAVSVSASFYHNNRKHKDIINYMSFFINQIPGVNITNYDYYNQYTYIITKNYQTFGFS